MDWYFLEENDDFLVPSDRESFDDVPEFSDEWCSWTVAQSKNSQPCGDDALPQHGRGLYADEMKESAFQEGGGGGGGSAQVDCCLRTSEESFECQTDCEMQDNMEEIDNIFCKHNFWDPWLLSFENILAAMLTDPQNHSVNLSRSESMNDPEACGIPLFAADLSEDFERTDDCSSSCVDMDMPNGPVILRAKGHDLGYFHSQDSDPNILVAADAEKPKCLEAAVLGELEDVILLLNEETRICFRDSLYRLASSSKQQLRKRDESRRTTETTAVASGPKMDPMWQSVRLGRLSTSCASDCIFFYLYHPLSI